MLSCIASGTIALTGIVFSLAFVVVQFSATAYSQRLVICLLRDSVFFRFLGVLHDTRDLKATQPLYETCEQNIALTMSSSTANAAEKRGILPDLRRSTYARVAMA